ncbi:hypothetical protein POM88_015400 [Heracleum sosnowskyi]|uniref:PORR domain-containing protein n=1 Tax=Heracleum sosnowskyi TaxID=360622 RepID=A0AAD8IMT3_9APIA|nr:hypothetical protein POM88_015400 [Heracleum sosnowskyi]
MPSHKMTHLFVRSKPDISRSHPLFQDDEFVVSALQKGKENVDLSVSGNGETELRKFKRGQNGLAFTMSFPWGYGAQKKVKAWMDEFQKLPYISPYEDCKKLKKDIWKGRLPFLFLKENPESCWYAV